MAIQITPDLNSPESPLSSEPMCPRCGEGQGTLPAVETASLERRLIRRCRRCGTRFSLAGGVTEYVFTCNDCALPFPCVVCLPHSEHRCNDCREGRPPEAFPDASLAEAMEGEVRAVLAERWSFVGSSALDDYLERLVRQISRAMPGLPPDPRVVLTDDDALRTLALPSGLVILSLGILDFVEDEAELTFAIGHELAHAATGEAATRLVRLGYHAATREQDAPASEAWTEAVLDLVRLGYGRHRERDADVRALDAILALGYDPESAVRLLRRVHRLVARSDPRVAEMAAAHPPAADRVRRIEKFLFRRWTRDRSGRLNREVFRRVTGVGVRPAGLRPVSLDAALSEDGDETGGGRVLRAAAWGAGILLLAATILALGLMLAG